MYRKVKGKTDVKKNRLFKKGYLKNVLFSPFIVTILSGKIVILIIARNLEKAALHARQLINRILNRIINYIKKDELKSR